MNEIEDDSNEVFCFQKMLHGRQSDASANTTLRSRARKVQLPRSRGLRLGKHSLARLPTPIDASSPRLLSDEDHYCALDAMIALPTLGAMGLNQ